MNQPSIEKQVRVTHNGESVVVTESKWMEAADALVEKHGPGVPKVEFIDPVSTVAPTEPAPSEPKKMAEVISLPTANSKRRGIDIDEEGKERSLRDLEAARKAGFAPKETIYERGTMVVDMGVDNARRFRKEWEKKPTVAAYCEDLIAKVQSESRHDATVEMRDLAMDNDGMLTVKGRRIPMTRQAFVGLVNRLGFGGAWYMLEKCWPELRAYNMNEQLGHLREEESLAIAQAAIEAAKGEGAREKTPEQLVMRTRKNETLNQHEAFAFVTPSYTAFDIDRVASALKEAAPEDARGTVTYDGYKAKFEVLFHSTVEPEKYVAGEFFRAGVIVRTDDSGGGGLRGSGVVWQNLCLNLIVIDEATAGSFNIRHVGDYERLVAQFRKGFEKALRSIDHFRKAWGYAVEENIIETAQKVQKDVPVSIEEAMPGFFRALLERELVPVKGAKKDAVPKLMEMWRKDESAAAGPTRAAVANAITRYAHEVNQDAFMEDEMQSAAGRIIYSKAPLLWAPPA